MFSSFYSHQVGVQYCFVYNPNLAFENPENGCPFLIIDVDDVVFPLNIL